MNIPAQRQELIAVYNKKKRKIKKRLSEFKQKYQENEKHIFAELCFCILTPQAKAISCDKAVKELFSSGLLFRGDKSAIRSRLRSVRFPNNKASYLIAARKMFQYRGKFSLKRKLNPLDTFKTRDWLVNNVKGLGYKEASHFLRNIGLGKDMAIFDIHILRNLKNIGMLRKIPTSINRKNYIALEDRLRKFSKAIDIPLDELDLLFWSNQTGFIFK